MNRREFIKQTAVATVAMPSLLRAQADDRGMETELEAYAHVNPASAKNKLYRESQEKKD